MKKIEWIKLLVINLSFILMIILPFLPGPPNKLVLVLSAFAQLAGFFGLLLIPIALLWFFTEFRTTHRINNSSPSSSITYWLVLIAAIIIGAMYFLLAVGLFVVVGFFEGFLGLLPIVLLLKPAINQIRKFRNTSHRPTYSIPLHLLTVPLVALFARISFMEPLSNYSRNIVIERSQILVSAIENYKMEFGVYPKTIQDLKPTYLKSIPSPNIMGVLNYRYNNINEQYAISFSQWLDFGSLEEIVLYDKANLHNVIDQYVKYDYSIDLHRVNGAFTVRNTRFDNWQYYHCD